MAESSAPTNARIRRQSRVLELQYPDGHCVQLPFELLRVFSPSAEVKGHGPGQGFLQTGKKDVLITGADPVGNYALQLHFSDGHNSGIFSWDYLWELACNQDQYWQHYLERLEQEGGSR